MLRRTFFVALLSPFASPAATEASEQAWPKRLIRIIVPFAPGGPDAAARLIGQQLSTQLGQSVIIDNRPGANGLIGSDAVAKAAPDGYTLLLTSTSFAVNPSIYRKLPYDPLRDFAYVGAPCGSEGLILAVNPKLPVQTLAELIALGRNPQSKLSYGSPGLGNTLHLAGALLNSKAGMHMVHVPYKGAGPALTALVGGEIDVMFVSPALSLPHIKAGKLRSLAFSGAKRWGQMPNLPTLAEAGLPGYTFDGGWYGIFAPAATPPEIVDRLASEVRAAVADPKVREQLATLGLVPMGLGPAEFRALAEREMRKFAELVKLAGIQPE